MAEKTASQKNVQGLLGRMGERYKKSWQARNKAAQTSFEKAHTASARHHATKKGSDWHAWKQASDQQAAQAKQHGAQDAFEKSILKGAQFGADVLGDEGLGRMGDDAAVQDVLARKKAIADKGLSREEVAAERAQSFRDIDAQTQTGMRQLQAQLARMGVKGATAGQQLIQRQMAGAQQKGEMAQELFLKSEQTKRAGLKEYGESLGNIKSFDLGQAAKEKNIILQSGLSFAQMGSSERTAKLAGEAKVQASKYQAAAQGGGGGGK